MIEQPSYPIQNTIGVDANAAYGANIESVSDLQAALNRAAELQLAFRPLGCGSNIVPMAEVGCYVGQIGIRGVEVLEENSDSVLVKVGAGEEWHPWVEHSLAEGWFGLENLICIPGSVGAAPIQNIGAYGVELERFIESVQCVDGNGELLELDQEGCEFAYRDSVFKRRLDLTVVSVSFRLLKSAHLVTDYPDVQQAIDEIDGVVQPRDVANAIASIRNAKLPQPADHSNVGSFFKNPIVASKLASDLKEKLPRLNTYRANTPDTVKLSAAQLIDSLGWKNRGSHGMYCWPNQPLVLVNEGARFGEDVIAFAEEIRSEVRSAYSVQLELEPSLLS